MNSLLQHIEQGHWDAFQTQLAGSNLTWAEAQGFMVRVIEFGRADMLDELLAHTDHTDYDVVAQKAVKAGQYECFEVLVPYLDDETLQQSLRTSVLYNREKILKLITPRVEAKKCWRLLEEAGMQSNPNLIDHLLNVCPVPLEQEMSEFKEAAPFILDTVMDVLNSGWNHCLERVLNLTDSDYDAAEVCVVACEKQNWDGARIALKFTTEENVRNYDVSFGPNVTQQHVQQFLALVESERLNAALRTELSDSPQVGVRRKM